MYFGSQAIEKIMAVIPQKIITALGVTGGLIPALGIGLLLTYVWDKKFLPFAVIGFFLVAYLNLNIMFVAILGGCIAMLYMQTKKKEG